MQYHDTMAMLTPPNSSPECDACDDIDQVPHLDLNTSSVPLPSPLSRSYGADGSEGLKSIAWRGDLTLEEKLQRRRWLSGGRGRSGLRIVIVTGACQVHSMGALR